MKPDRKPEPTMIGANGQPSRAAKRHANRLAKKKAETQEIAATAIPAPFRLGSSAGPGDSEVAGLLTAKQRKHQQMQGRVNQVGIGALPRGRPSEFTPEEGDVICAWIQSGGSLRGYVRQTGRTAATVYKWMRENAAFATLYAHAGRDRADTLAEETLEIADAAAINPTLEGVQAAKLRVDARKWIVSKLSPAMWGDRQVVEHSGAVNIRIGVPQKPVATVEMVDEVGRLPAR